MTKEEIAKLIVSIGYSYPQFRKTSITNEGKLMMGMINEWYDRIGFIEYEKANKLFERYLLSENNTHAPGIPYFLGVGKQAEIKAYENPTTPTEWKVEYGQLWGKVGDLWYEYGNEDCEPYYYNGIGRICRKSSTGAEIVVIP